MCFVDFADDNCVGADGGDADDDCDGDGDDGDGGDGGAVENDDASG